MHIVMDDIHKMEFIIGGVCGILLILFWIGCEIDIKIREYMFKKDMEKKKQKEEEDDQ